MQHKPLRCQVSKGEEREKTEKNLSSEISFASFAREQHRRQNAMNESHSAGSAFRGERPAIIKLSILRPNKGEAGAEQEADNIAHSSRLLRVLCL